MSGLSSARRRAIAASSRGATSERHRHRVRRAASRRVAHAPPAPDRRRLRPAASRAGLRRVRRPIRLGDRLTSRQATFSPTRSRAADVLVMGHILHDWDLDEKRMLLHKAYDALPEGGALIVYDAMIDDDRRQNAFGLLMSLNMLIETPGGFDYTGADCRAWMAEAGFRESDVEHLPGRTRWSSGSNKPIRLTPCARSIRAYARASPRPAPCGCSPRRSPCRTPVFRAAGATIRRSGRHRRARIRVVRRCRGPVHGPVRPRRRSGARCGSVCRWAFRFSSRCFHQIPLNTLYTGAPICSATHALST